MTTFHEFLQMHLQTRFRGNEVLPVPNPDGSPNAIAPFIVREVEVEPVQVASIVGRDWRQFEQAMGGNLAVQEAGSRFFASLLQPSGAYVVKLYGARDKDGVPESFLSFTTNDEMPDFQVPKADET